MYIDYLGGVGSWFCCFFLCFFSFAFVHVFCCGVYFGGFTLPLGASDKLRHLIVALPVSSISRLTPPLETGNIE